MLKHTFNKKAFTLVELLIVIVIIGILFVALVSRLDFTTDRSKGAGVQSDLKSYATAATSAAIAYVGFSEDTDTLMHNLNRFLDTKLDLTVNGGSLETAAQDPWGTDYLILVSRPEGTFGELTFISAGPDRDYFTNDDEAVTVVCNGAGLVNTTFPMQQAHNHHFEAIETGNAMKVPASCTRPAVYYYSCQECKMKNTDEFEAGAINPNKHLQSVIEYTDNGEPSTHVATTKCIACNTIIHSNNEPHGEPVGGYCTICGAEAHTHVFDQLITSSNTMLAAETCTNPAVFYKSCECGAKGSETFTFGSSLGHDFTKEQSTLSYLASNATCTDRARYYYSCTRCGLAGTETFETGGLGSHKYNQQVVSNAYISSEATCTLPAKYFYSCACGDSGETTFMSGAPNGHHYLAATCTLPQTCTVCHMTSGAVGGHHEQFIGSETVHSNCSVCGVVIRANHTFGSEITTPGTCTDKGITTYTCLCGYSYTEQNVPKNFENHSGLPTNGGDSAVHSKYACCNATISTEHSYIGTVIDPGTCTVDGWTKYECACGYYYTLQDVPASGHTFDREVATDQYIKDAATCTGVGLYFKSCACGVAGTEYFESGTANGGNHTGGTEFVGTADVHTKYTCCGATASTAHSYTTRVETQATCQTQGVYKSTCVCGYYYTRTVGKDLTTHTGNIVNAAEANAHTKYTCCGATAVSTHGYTTTTTGNACSGSTTTYSCSCGYNYSTSVGGNGHTYDYNNADSIIYYWTAGCTECYATIACKNCGSTKSETGTVVRIDKNNVMNYDRVSDSADSYNVQTCRGYKYDYIIVGLATIPDGRCKDWHYYGEPNPDNHDFQDGKCSICDKAEDPKYTWVKYSATATTSYTNQTTATGTFTYTSYSDTDTLTLIVNSSYSFNPSGFYMSGTEVTKTFRAGASYDASNMIGKWLKMTNGKILKISSIDFVGYIDGRLAVTYTGTQQVEATGHTTYSRGWVSYGNVRLPEGEIPEGDILDGSYEEGFVIIQSGYSCYYYEKQED